MKHLSFLMASLLLAGCAATTTTTITPPTESQTAASWREADAWWSGFGSAELVALIDALPTDSLDIAAASARVQQAEAQSRIDDAALWPALSGTLGAGRNGRLDGHTTVAGNARTLRLDASYELDLWGRVRAASDSARAGWRASAFDRDTVRLTVNAGAASAWLRAVGLQERLAIAERNLADAERLLAVVLARHRAGAALPLELAQQRGIVATQRRAVATLQQDVATSRTALAVWRGQTEAAAPVAATTAATAWQALRVPALEARLPSDLLARRPDIARAEAQLAAADANVAAARAAMLPRLSLSAAVGSGGARWRDLLDSPVYSVAAALVAPIFDAGRLAAGRDLALARREEMLLAYRAAIVAAFADAQFALQAIDGLDAQRTAQAEELAQATRARALAETRYRAGADTLLTLLDAQRTLYAAEDVAAQLRLARLHASVALYKALGGGWPQGEVAAKL